MTPADTSNILTLKEDDLEEVQQRERREECVNVHVEGVAPLHVGPVLVAPQVFVAHVPGTLLVIKMTWTQLF